MKKSDIFWQSYLNLEKEALEVSKYIFFTDEKIINSGGIEKSEHCTSQLETFSPYIADLLVRCCVQIEAISKELYFDIDGSKKRGDKALFFDGDCLKEIDKKWKTSKKVVLVVSPSFNFTKDENKILKPLKNAHKGEAYWEKAYQAVKHDRYSFLHHGNVKAFIHALAALYLLNIYYRNDSFIINYQGISQLDYSLGSALFSVNSPKTNQPWYDNVPIESESPFVAQYQDKEYQRIKEIQKNESQALDDYWFNQPEQNELEFNAQLQAAQDRRKNNQLKRIEYLEELGIYRLNKKIPSTLPFEKRRELLIKSEEWNCWIHQNNPHLKAEEITEENIQNEIDNVGKLWGIQLYHKYQPLEWLKIAMNDRICRVFIPQ